ncbi:MAG: hypothetical protein QXJ64_10110 [Thermosphaera sp.]
MSFNEEARRLLTSFLKLTARYCGYEVEEKNSGIFVHGTHLTGLKHPLDMYRAIESLLRETAGKHLLY